MKAKTIMIQGTGSSVGKSVIVTALCRIFLQDGFRPCPFKAQNMSLNSFVTKEGGEMGRAQVVQAQAARLSPHVDMNPVLIKPTADCRAQIILQGKPVGNMRVKEYSSYKGEALKKVMDSFNRLKQRYEIMVIEGAGSPAEVNLKANDIVNMKMAEMADAPVVLVGDIDKGGIFASLVGTLELLSKNERKMIKGFIINKFRGDKSLLNKGIRFLEKKTKKPVLGVIPYFSASGGKDIRIPEEDSVALESRKQITENGAQKKNSINIAVIKLPYTSNFTDFDTLENEPDVRLDYVNSKADLDSPDVIILPGTKNTIADLLWLRQSGLADKILITYHLSLITIIVGICGGYQMLGNKIYDIHNIESNQEEINGLGLLPIVTYFRKNKLLTQVRAKECASGLEISGYEIHHGKTEIARSCRPFFEVIERRGKSVTANDGMVSEDERVFGTYIHGIFDSDDFRRGFLNNLRKKKSLPEISKSTSFNLDREFDKLADLVRKNINLKLLYKILNYEL